MGSFEEGETEIRDEARSCTLKSWRLPAMQGEAGDGEEGA